MKNIIKGNFEVTSTPQPGDEFTQSLGAMRMKFEKNFEGPLKASSIVSMMGIMDQSTGSGGYVALERVEGSVDGKHGSFCLQHSCTMSRGTPSQQIIVVPNTGTQELKGLSGQMSIDIHKDGAHFYTFEFEIE